MLRGGTKISKSGFVAAALLIVTCIGAAFAPAHVARANEAIVVAPPVTNEAAVTPATSDTELLQPVAMAQAAVAAPPQIRTNHRNVRTIVMQVTAYCPCAKCCGLRAAGITASGRRVSFNHGRFVAADPSVLAMGTKLIVPGYAGETNVKVIDTGSAIKGNRLDVFFKTHRQAQAWGSRMLEVQVMD